MALLVDGINLDYSIILSQVTFHSRRFHHLYVFNNNDHGTLFFELFFSSHVYQCHFWIE